MTQANSNLRIVPRDQEAFRLSLILAALESLMKYDTDIRLRAEVRRRYLNLTAKVQS